MPDPVFDAFNQASAAPAAGIGKAQVADPVFDAFNKGAAAPPSGIGGTPKPPSDPVFDAFNQRYAISSLPPDKLEQLSAGADCSLFTQRYYAQKGVALPRTAIQQFRSTPMVLNQGQLDPSKLQPGDLMFFDNKLRTPFNTDGKAVVGAEGDVEGYVNHVGIYAGNGMVLHDPGNGTQATVPLSHFSGMTFMGASRPKGGASAGQALPPQAGGWKPFEQLTAAERAQAMQGGNEDDPLSQMYASSNPQIRQAAAQIEAPQEAAGMGAGLEAGTVGLASVTNQALANGLANALRYLNLRDLADRLNPGASQSRHGQTDAEWMAEQAAHPDNSPPTPLAKAIGFLNPESLLAAGVTVAGHPVQYASGVGESIKKLATGNGTPDDVVNALPLLALVLHGAGMANVVIPKGVVGEAASESGVSGYTSSPGMEGGFHTAPEAPATIAAQVAALEAGQRKAVLITPGEEMPEIPEGFKTTKTPAGMWIHNPTLKATAIRAAVKDGSFGELLGHVEPKSASTNMVVVARDPASGLELQSSVVSPGNLAAQVSRFGELWPGAAIETGGAELADRVLAERGSGQAGAVGEGLTGTERAAGVVGGAEPAELTGWRGESGEPGKYGASEGEGTDDGKLAAANQAAVLEAKPPAETAPAASPAGTPAELGQGAPATGVRTRAVAPQEIEDLEKNLPGVRNLPDEVKASALARATANGVEKQGAMSTGEYASMLQGMGIDSAQAAAMAKKGGLSPMQGSYLLHLYDNVDAAAQAARDDVVRLTKSGADKEIIEAAQAKADLLDQQATDVLRGATHSTSEAARALRMTQELGKGTLDLSRLIRMAEKGGGVTPAGEAVIRDLYGKLKDAEANSAAKSTPLPAAPVVEVRPGFGSGNTLFTSDAVAAALKNIAQKTSRLGAGIDPSLIGDLVKIGGYYIEGGLREFASWARQMRSHVPEMSTDNLRDLYSKSWQAVKDRQMAGSALGGDVQTQTGKFGPEKTMWVKRPDGAWERVGTGEFKQATIGVQDPEVAAARSALLKEMQKYLKPGWGQVAGRYLRALVLWHPAVLTHILASGLSTQTLSELGRIPTSLRNMVTVGLLKQDPAGILRQGFSPKDFSASLLGGFARGLGEARAFSGEGNVLQKTGQFFRQGEAGRVIAEGHNSQTAAANGIDFFNSPVSLRDAVATKEGWLRGEAPDVIGRIHGAMQQLGIAQPTIMRTIREDAYLIAQRTPEAQLETMSPNLTGLKGKALRLAAIRELVKNPTSEMMGHALDESVKQSMMEGNRVTKWMDEAHRIARTGGDAGQIADALLTAFMPVVRPGTNTVFHAAEFSPIGMGRAGGGYLKAAMNGGIKTLTAGERTTLVKLMDNGAVGTGLMYLGAKLFQHGSVTGGYRPRTVAPGPQGQRERTQFSQASQASGGVANVFGIKAAGSQAGLDVGSKSIPLRFFGFGGMLMAFGADMARADSEGGTPVQGVAQAGLPVASSALPPMQGAERLQKMLEGLASGPRRR